MHVGILTLLEACCMVAEGAFPQNTPVAAHMTRLRQRPQKGAQYKCPPSPTAGSCSASPSRRCARPQPPAGLSAPRCGRRPSPAPRRPQRTARPPCPCAAAWALHPAMVSQRARVTGGGMWAADVMDRMYRRKCAAACGCHPVLFNTRGHTSTVYYPSLLSTQMRAGFC